MRSLPPARPSLPRPEMKNRFGNFYSNKKKNADYQKIGNPHFFVFYETTVLLV